MFLGNLSAATERHARKGKKKDEEGNEINDEPLEEYMKLGKAGDKAILYTEDKGDIPKDVLLQFLQDASKMLLHDTNIRNIIDRSVEKKMALNEAAVDFQRDVLEYNYQIQRDHGCKSLSIIQNKYSGDNEILDAAHVFMQSCLRSYINQLKMRSKLYKKGVLIGPNPNESMGRTTILEFFEACNAYMVLPEVKEELKSIAQTTGKMPNERVIEMQRNIIKILGFNPDFGVSCLNRISQDFAKDQEVLMKMQYFATAAEFACREAQMSDEERTKFYLQMPRVMHNFPHMWVLQQRMMQHNHMHNHGMMDGRTGTSSSSSSSSSGANSNTQNRMQDIEALKQSGILNLLSSPEGREKLQQLSGRVQQARERVEDDVNSWDDERKLNYWNNFSDHPLLEVLNSAGNDPMAKIKTFIEMNEDELEQTMTLILILSSNNGELLQKLRASVAASGASSSSSSSSGKHMLINNLVTTLGSVQNMRPPSSRPQQDHDHDHSHSHDHGHSCSHHGHSQAKPDISKGKVDRMER